jgi:hypothetical protein
MSKKWSGWQELNLRDMCPRHVGGRYPTPGLWERALQPSPVWRPRRGSGLGAPVNWIAADIVRLQDGILVEHWDVIQDEATQEQSKSGLPMFGDKFPE